MSKFKLGCLSHFWGLKFREILFFLDCQTLCHILVSAKFRSLFSVGQNPSYFGGRLIFVFTQTTQNPSEMKT